MMRWRRITAGFGAILLLPCLAFASEPPPEALLARHLAEKPEVKDTIVAALGRQASSGTGTELLMGLLRNDERVWKAFAEELPPHLATRLSPERLAALSRSYADNPAQEWDASGAEMVALCLSLGKAENRFSRELARVTCSAGILAPNIDKAREKAGKTDRPFQMSPQLLERLRPVLQRLDETCECLGAKIFEAFGARTFTGEVSREEMDPLVQKALTSGQCRDPFEDLVL